jgi:hypothetical protein
MASALRLIAAAIFAPTASLAAPDDELQDRAGFSAT